MKADVYRNLNNGKYSVRSREPGTYGRVIGHEDRLLIENVSFVVQPAGRERVLREQRKNVHAFVRGDCYVGTALYSAGGVRVRYNPYESASFVECEGGHPVDSARAVRLTPNGVFAYGLGYAE